MYLLDAEVAFELRRARVGAAGGQGLGAWVAATPRQSLFLSVISLLELEAAIARTERRDRAAGAALRAWLTERLVPAFEGRILAVDAPVVVRRASLPYADMRDGLLAATALHHSLTLATRNADAFRAGKVRAMNPFAYAPEEDDADWDQLGRAGSQWLRGLFVRS